MITYQHIGRQVQYSYGANTEDADSPLVKRAQAGDLSAFELLVFRHQENISRAIFRITRNREDAEDQVQETFLRAFRGLRGFRGDSKFTTWLTRIAVNQALMCLRKRRPQDISLDQTFCDGTNDVRADLFERRPNPEQSYEHTEACEMLAKLPDILRSALILTQFHGYTHADVATKLGISTAAAKSRVLRARRRLDRQFDRGRGLLPNFSRSFRASAEGVSKRV